MSDEKTCAERVAEPPGFWHHHACGRKAKTERAGRPMCGIHANAYDRHAAINAKFGMAPPS